MNSKITDKGFSEAVKKLPRLEEVNIPLCNISEVSLEALGLSCTRLKSLEYCSGSSLESSDSDKKVFVIAETMPGLRHLDMEGHKLTELGVLTIIDKCTLLESLDIRDCLYLSEDLKKRCIDQTNDLELPDPDNSNDDDDDDLGNFDDDDDDDLNNDDDDDDDDKDDDDFYY